MGQDVDHNFWRGHPRENDVYSPLMDEPHGTPTVIPYRGRRQDVPLVVDDDDRNFYIKLLQKIRGLIYELSGRRCG